MHNTACGNITYPDASGECGPAEESVAEDRVTRGFRHLDVVLAVRSEESGPSRFCVGLAIPGIERPEVALAKVGEGTFRAADKNTKNRSRAPEGANTANPGIREILSIFATVKSVGARLGEIHADDTRLAIFARLLCLRSAERQFLSHIGGYGSAHRRMGAQKWRYTPAVEYFDKHLADHVAPTGCSVPSKSKRLPSYTNTVATTARDSRRRTDRNNDATERSIWISLRSRARQNGPPVRRRGGPAVRIASQGTCTSIKK